MTLAEKGVMQVHFDEESRQYASQWSLVLEGAPKKRGSYVKSQESKAMIQKMWHAHTNEQFKEFHS